MSALTEKEKDLLALLAKLKRPPRKPSDEIEWTESEVQRRLNGLVEELMKAAVAAGNDERLSLEERALYLRQGDILSTAVADLIARLPDPDDRFTLLKALGSTTLIAYEAAEHLDAYVREQKRTTPATEATTALGDDVRESVVAVAKRRHDPAYPPKSRRSFAQQIVNDVNKELRRRNPKHAPVSWHTVEKHLRPLNLSYRNK